MLSIALIVPIAVFLRLAGVVLVHVTGLLIRSFALWHFDVLVYYLLKTAQVFGHLDALLQ